MSATVTDPTSLMADLDGSIHTVIAEAVPVIRLEVGDIVTNMGRVEAINYDGAFLTASIRGTVWSLASGRGDLHNLDVTLARLGDREHRRRAGVTGSPDDRLITAHVAALAGITEDSVREYRRRGTIPEPDFYVGRTPVWERSTIERWLRTRPGPGRPRKG